MTEPPIARSGTIPIISGSAAKKSAAHRPVMLLMKKSRKALLGASGSLLLEAFIALLVLSIGITSSLRVFSESLLISSRIMETAIAKTAADHFFFDRFAYPGSVEMPEEGFMIIPIETESNQNYRFEIRSEELNFEVESEGETAGGDDENQAGPKPASRYRIIHGSILRDPKQPVFDIDAVVRQNEKRRT